MSSSAMFPRRVRLLALALVFAALTAVAPSASAFECSACQYTARNCSALESDAPSATPTPTASDSIAVCDATGKIQLDDVFCDNDECQCAGEMRCASLVVGCTNIFQARSRTRCISVDAIERRFHKCAVAQALTTLSATNLDPDWVYFKDPVRCSSRDCAAVRQFHQSGVVQCGYLIVAWKDSDALYHFIVDGSRASDMAAGVFHYEAPFESSELTTTGLRETRIEPCFALQTRNQQSDGAGCDGYYIQYDTAVQFSNSQDYQLSKLTWPIWFAVVGSVAAAVIAVAALALASYRFRRMDTSDGADDELLHTLDGDGDKTASTGAGPDSGLPVTSKDLRQRTLSPRSSGDDVASTSHSI